MSITAVEFPDAFNMADYFVFSNIEAGRGNKTAIIFEGREITYNEVADKVQRVAQALVGGGLLPEQRVLLCMRDCPEFVYGWFGAIKAGAVVAQINPLLPESDYDYYLAYVKPQFAFVDEASAAAFGAAASRSRHCAGGTNVIGIGAAAGRQFDTWLAAPHRETSAPWPTRKDDPALALHQRDDGAKQGRRSQPHPFSVQHRSLCQGFYRPARKRRDDFRRAALFGYATGTNLMFPFAVGATTVLSRESPTPEILFDLIARHRATVFTSVPTLISKMLEAPPDRRRDISQLRFMWSAGEALPRDLHDRWNATFGVPIIDGIGSAESFHIYISNRPSDVRPGSLGRLVPGYEARLLDDDGKPVARGDVGTLWLKGDSAALHYHGAYEKSKDHLRGGWIVSGDKFREDEDGYWYYEGRGDDLLKSDGIYVSPLEVENCLIQHGAVRECCVIGRKGENGLEKPLAVVFLNDNFTASAALEAEIIALAKSKLARYKAPHWVAFRSTPLPRNDRDKTDRKALRREYT
ncbi:MAG: benzoate-CoA ligase family protein [Rhizomicrobium sp.]